MKIKDETIQIKQKFNSSKSTFPKVKIDGFHDAVKNTDMLEVVEQIKKDRNTKS